MTAVPGEVSSISLCDVPVPADSDGKVLVETLEVGLCGTDREIAAGRYGRAPSGNERLVIGHENLGMVLEAPPNCALGTGDLVVGMVREPDPVPCGACAHGEPDMCSNGLYLEHGIWGADGYARDRWRSTPEMVVKLEPGLRRVGVLLEPTTVVAKAWEQISRIGARGYFAPRVVAVTGAGPIGLLAAMIGIGRGLEVHVFDIVDSGPKPELVAELGAEYHRESLTDSKVLADIVIECTGAGSAVLEAITHAGPGGICCLAGLSHGGSRSDVDVAAISKRAVLGNEVVFGTVSANRHHYEQSAEILASGDGDWLDRLISRRVAIEKFRDAFAQRPDDVKVVLELCGP